MKKFKFNDEVFHSLEPSFSLKRTDIDDLINLAKLNQRRRVRLCSHSSPEDLVHEMFIVHKKGEYIRPHKHINKTESMIVLQGEVDYVCFNNSGKVVEVIRMGDTNSQLPFYFNNKNGIFHTLIIRSEWLAFLEVTSGPFNKCETLFPKWCPEESDSIGIDIFQAKVNKLIKNHT